MELIRIPSISGTFRRTLDIPPIPETRTGSYSFHSERFRNSYGIGIRELFSPWSHRRGASGWRVKNRLFWDAQPAHPLCARTKRIRPVKNGPSSGACPHARCCGQGAKRPCAGRRAHARPFCPRSGQAWSTALFSPRRRCTGPNLPLTGEGPKADSSN